MQYGKWTTEGEVKSSVAAKYLTTYTGVNGRECDGIFVRVDRMVNKGGTADDMICPFNLRADFFYFRERTTLSLRKKA